MVSTVASQQECFGFEPDSFLCGVCMYSPCMRGFSLGALASSHLLNTCRLIGDSSVNRGVNVSMNGCLSIRDVEEGCCHQTESETKLQLTLQLHILKRRVYMFYISLYVSFIDRKTYIHMGDTVVQWLALLHHSKRVSCCPYSVDDQT